MIGSLELLEENLALDVFANPLVNKGLHWHASANPLPHVLYTGVYKARDESLTESGWFWQFGNILISWCCGF